MDLPGPNPRRAPRMSGSVTILTLLAMVACLAATTESHAALRREARTMRILTCHAGVGEHLVAVAVAHDRPRRLSPRTQRRVELRPDAGMVRSGPPLREALLAIPPPAC